MFVIAEATVKEHGPHLPIGVFRPAIVVSTCYEPMKGWTDIFGPSGISYGVLAGLIRTLNVRSDCSTELTELIPVDLTVNALIATAWDVASNKVLKLYKKIHKFIAVTSYFTRKSWKFHNENTRELWDRLTVEDQKTFFFSTANFDWDSYMSNYVRGLRLYIFKDDPSTIPSARKRMVLLMVFHYMIKYTFLMILLWSSYKLVLCILSADQMIGATSVDKNIAVVR